MRALSLFSGIGGIDLGLERAGFRVVGQCEADEWCRAVLAARFPGVPCWDDVARVGRGDDARADEFGPRRVGGRDWPDAVDLLCGGFPCQDVSVAGKRAGLAGARTGLFWEFLRIAETLRPRWLLLENVPGLLSSNHGRDFATIIDALDGAGYVGAWRILDSRWFGVPQRRRRVFIVCADARFDPRGERASEVLAVGTRCSRHPRTGGTPGPDVAGALAGRSASRLDDACAGGGQLVAATLSSGGHPNSNMPGRRNEDDVNLVVQRGPTWEESLATAFHLTQDPISGDVAPAMSRGNRQGTATIGVMIPSGLQGIVWEDARTQEADAREVLRALRDALGTEAPPEWRPRVPDPLQPQEVLRSLLYGGVVQGAPEEARSGLDDGALSRAEPQAARAMRAVRYLEENRGTPPQRQLARQLARELAAALSELPQQGTRATHSGVRRLTPREAERLQGFPDDWTLIPWNGKPSPDSRRYAALGNAVTVPVAEWIGHRIITANQMEVAA